MGIGPPRPAIETAALAALHQKELACWEYSSLLVRSFLSSNPRHHGLPLPLEPQGFPPRFSQMPESVEFHFKQNLCVSVCVWFACVLRPRSGRLFLFKSSLFDPCWRFSSLRPPNPQRAVPRRQ